MLPLALLLIVSLSAAMRALFAYYMKKTLLIGCMALSAHAFSQTTIFSDDFENGDANWTLNENGTGNNQWRVNVSYDGNAGSSIANVPDQPLTFANAPRSAYLHILNVPNCSGFFPVTCNAHYEPADLSNQYAKMTADISTLNATNVSFNCWFLCGGEPGESYGNVEYSIDGGTTWLPIGNELSGTYAWESLSITDPAFDNQATLRFAFHWRNENSGTNPPLSVDELSITGVLSNQITMQHLNESTYCPGTADAIGFEALGTYNTGNVFTAQLSDANGSFAAPTTIGTLASTTTGFLSIAGTYPASTPAGANYHVRVVASNPAIIGGDNGEDVTFLALPTINTTTTPANGTICTGSSATLNASGATTYTWAPAATLSSPNGATVTATPAVTTTYTVTGTQFEGCTNTQTVTITVDDCAGIKENNSALLKLYPNPAKDELWVAFETTTGMHTIELLDLNGRVVKSIDIEPGNLDLGGIALKIDISECEQGTYIARISYEGGSTTGRFTKD
jgi:hypothetical protein